MKLSWRSPSSSLFWSWYSHFESLRNVILCSPISPSWDMLLWPPHKKEKVPAMALKSESNMWRNEPQLHHTPGPAYAVGGARGDLAREKQLSRKSSKENRIFQDSGLKVAYFLKPKDASIFFGCNIDIPLTRIVGIWLCVLMRLRADRSSST